MSSQAATPGPLAVITPQQLGYILNGACILGSGGGGSYSDGQQVVQYIGNRSVSLIPAVNVPDTFHMAVSAFVGSPDAAANQKLNFKVATQAFNDLAKSQNLGFNCVLPGEVGAVNTLVPMAVAADDNMGVVDGAGACRAIPGFLMCTYAAKQIPASPMMLTDGNSQVVVNCANSISDPVVRGIIGGNAFQQDSAMAFWTMDGQTMKSAVIPNMTSQALAIGQALAQAIGWGQDPVKAVRQYLTQPNYVLCTGTIVAHQEATSGGFDFGSVVIAADDGSEVTIYNQNENLIAFSSTSVTPLAIGPDLICYMTTTGQVFSNADIKTIGNQKIVVIGVPAFSMRSQFIINQFRLALAGIGYGGPYIPIEDLNAQRIAA